MAPPSPQLTHTPFGCRNKSCAGKSHRILNTGVDGRPRRDSVARRRPSSCGRPARDPPIAERRRFVRAGRRPRRPQRGGGRRRQLGLQVLAYGGEDGDRLEDGGQTWKRVTLPRRMVIRDLAFLSARFGYVVDTRGRVWRTTNAGKTWTELRSLGALVDKIEFTDARSGYAVVGGTGVLRRTDGGKSWHPQVLGRARIVDIRAAGPSTTPSPGRARSTRRLRAATPPAQRSRSDRGEAPHAQQGRARDRDRHAPPSGRRRGGLRRDEGALAAELPACDRRVEWHVRDEVDCLPTSVFVAQILGDADHAGMGTSRSRSRSSSFRSENARSTSRLTQASTSA